MTASALPKLSTATLSLSLPGVAFITGGSSGLGAGAALAFADLGAKIAVADINTKLGEETVAKINGTYPGAAIFVRCDVSQEADIEAAIAQTVAAFGRIDYAINAAGIVVAGDKVTLIKDTDASVFDRTQNIDARGVFLCMKHQIRQMETQDVPAGRPRASRGVIVNLASRASLEGVSKFGSYCSAKHAVLGMSRVAAVECAPNQIRVVAMCPGLVKSPGHVEAAKEVDDFLLTTVPMGRFGVVEEITDGLIFLCSDMASFLTGNAFEIDGGCAAR